MTVKNPTMPEIFKNPRYRGKHVILVAGKIFTANTGQGASEILEKVRKKYPHQTPEIAYLPKSTSLILCMSGTDFSILPHYVAKDLSIDLDAETFFRFG